MAATEITALKVAVLAQHHAIQKLHVELEEEREASATAASEALSMILRLQREKAEVNMEANQYKRMAEEKMHHSEESRSILEELMWQKEMETTSLKTQLQAYQHKFLSIGLSNLEIGEMDIIENSSSCRNGAYMDDMSEHGTDMELERERRVLPLRELIPGQIDEDPHHEFDVDCENGTRDLWTASEESEIEDCDSYYERIEQLDERVKVLPCSKNVIQKLYVELEEEREASATAASEVLSMILRLQREKAEVNMEANQYKRMAEEKMHHSEESRSMLEELMWQKEMETTSLKSKLQAYQHKFLSIGLSDLEIGEMDIIENSPLCGNDAYMNDRSDHGADMELERERLVFPLRESTPRQIDEDPRQEFDVDCEIGTRDLWNASEESKIEDCDSYFERIEQLDERVKVLYCTEHVDERVKSEWVSANKELHETNVAYSASLNDGSSSFLWHSS